MTPHLPTYHGFCEPFFRKSFLPVFPSRDQLHFLVLVFRPLVPRRPRLSDPFDLSVLSSLSFASDSSKGITVLPLPPGRTSPHIKTLVSPVVHPPHKSAKRLFDLFVLHPASCLSRLLLVGPEFIMKEQVF